MHSRMRFRVSEFQKVLNRAKAEVAQTERRTVTYVIKAFTYDRLLTVLLQREDIGYTVDTKRICREVSIECQGLLCTRNFISNISHD